MGFHKHANLPILQRLPKNLLSAFPLLRKLPKRERTRHFDLLNSLRARRGRIEGIEERDFLLRALQWSFASPRPRHRRWCKGQKSRFANRNGLGLGGLGVAVLELEWSVREQIGHTRFADDDGSIAVGRDYSVFDRLIILGTAVEGLESRIRGWIRGFWRIGSKSAGFGWRVFGNWDWR